MISSTTDMTWNAMAVHTYPGCLLLKLSVTSPTTRLFSLQSHPWTFLHSHCLGSSTRQYTCAHSCATQRSGKAGTSTPCRSHRSRFIKGGCSGSML